MKNLLEVFSEWKARQGNPPRVKHEGLPTNLVLRRRALALLEAERRKKRKLAEQAITEAGLEQEEAVEDILAGQ